MKKDEFLEEIKKFNLDDEIKVRYYTYNKNDYIDIVGQLSILVNLPIRYSLDGNGLYYKDHYGQNYEFILKNIYITDIHKNYDRNNLPKLKMLIFKNEEYFRISSSNITFIKPASIRAYKINKLKNKYINKKDFLEYDV